MSKTTDQLELEATCDPRIVIAFFVDDRSDWDLRHLNIDALSDLSALGYHSPRPGLL